MLRKASRSVSLTSTPISQWPNRRVGYRSWEVGNTYEGLRGMDLGTMCPEDAIAGFPCG